MKIIVYILLFFAFALMINESRAYTIQPGDTLSELAESVQCSTCSHEQKLGYLKILNQVQNQDLIYAGQELNYRQKLKHFNIPDVNLAIAQNAQEVMLKNIVKLKKEVLELEKTKQKKRHEVSLEAFYDQTKQVISKKGNKVTSKMEYESGMKLGHGYTPFESVPGFKLNTGVSKTPSRDPWFSFDANFKLEF